MNLRPFALALLISALLTAAPAFAGVTDFRVDHGSALGADGVAYTTNDLFIDFTGRYTGSQVLVTLDAGTIHQETFGGSGFDVAPNATLLDLVPTLTADTYFTQGGAAGQLAYGNPNMVGGPVNLDPAQSWSLQTPTQLAHAWAPAPGADIEDQSGFHTLRLSLSADARGSFQYLASADSEIYYTNAGNRPGTAPRYAIEAGRVVALENVPEPEPEPEPTFNLPVSDNPWLWNDFLTPTHVADPIPIYDPRRQRGGRDYLLSSYLMTSTGLKYGNLIAITEKARLPLTRQSSVLDNVIDISTLTYAYADGHLAAPQAFALTPEPSVIGWPALLLLAARGRVR